MYLVYTEYIKEVIIPTDGNIQLGWIRYWWNLYPYGNYNLVEKTDIEYIITGEGGFTKKCSMLCKGEEKGMTLSLGSNNI